MYNQSHAMRRGHEDENRRRHPEHQSTVSNSIESRQDNMKQSEGAPADHLDSPVNRVYFLYRSQNGQEFKYLKYIAYRSISSIE
jgi:hypothetical protein